MAKLTPAAMLSVAVLLASAPASAAVLAAGPVEAAFSDLVSFDPSARGLAFDAALGTLNGVTLSFEGTVGVALAAPAAADRRYPATLDADVTVYHSGGAIPVVLDPLVVPLSVRLNALSASGSAARAFDVVVPGASYGSGALSIDVRFTGSDVYTSRTTTDAVFTGTVSALFDYTPLGDGGGPAGSTAVPEPAALALLAVGLAGSVAVRRRRDRR